MMQPATLHDISDRQTRFKARKDLLDFLVTNTRDPHDVAARTILLAYLYGSFPEGTSQRKLANFLGISEARVSAAIKFLRDKTQCL